jgi:signal transduction histidine kinase
VGNKVVFTAIIDLILALILNIYGPKKEATKWACLFLIFGSLGSFFDVAVVPVISNIFILSLFPYGFIMFAIVYSEMVTRRVKNILVYILFLPSFVTIFEILMNSDFLKDFAIFPHWVILYYVGGCFLFIYTYLVEKNREKKRSHLITVCFVVPPIIVIIDVEHLDRLLQYKYVSVFIGIAFVVFIIFASRVGALGVKINFEIQLHDQKIKGIASGAAMLNHAVKNRITNIDMLTERVKGIVQSRRHEHMEEDIERILEETKVMMLLVKRIQKQIEDVEIVEGTANLIEMMTQTLHSNRYLLESKRISISTDYSINCDLLCDKLHLQEVFSNIISNAIDAVDEEGGTLAIRIYESKGGVRIDFTDNGKGMDKKAAAQIFDPFYSTKQKDGNFGLGLSYCYLIAQKHGGSIKVLSNEREGTTFTLQLPKYRKV